MTQRMFYQFISLCGVFLALLCHVLMCTLCLTQLTKSLLAVAFLSSFGSSMLYGFNLAVVNSPAEVCVPAPSSSVSCRLHRRQTLVFRCHSPWVTLVPSRHVDSRGLFSALSYNPLWLCPPSTCCSVRVPPVMLLLHSHTAPVALRPKTWRVHRYVTWIITLYFWKYSDTFCLLIRFSWNFYQIFLLFHGTIQFKLVICFKQSIISLILHSSWWPHAAPEQQ